MCCVVVRWFSLFVCCALLAVCGLLFVSRCSLVVVRRALCYVRCLLFVDC